MRKIITTSLVLFLSTTGLADSDNITWIAQDYPPYAHVDVSGNKSGIAIDMTTAIMKNIASNQTSQDIDIKTFSKFFVMSHNKQNTVFFPLLRTPDREDRFKWVGPIALNQPVLMAKIASNIVINSPSDLNQYSIASIDGYNAVKLLTDQGVNLSVFKLNSTDEVDAKMLQNDEVKIIACDKLACQSALTKVGANLADYAVIYKLPSSELSYAFNKDTDDALIAKVSKALAEIKK